MADQYNVAIVGCGNISSTHAKVAAAHPALTIVAAIDIVPEQANKLADKLETQLGEPRPAVFETLDAALASCDIDVIAVCTPTGLHAEIAEQGVKAGKHVIIEKPIDADMARARRLADLATASEGKLVASVISQHRFDPDVVMLRRAAHSGRFGKVTSAVATISWWRSQGYYDSADWRGTWAMDGGGALMNQGIHTIDITLSIMGRPVEVYAMTALLAHERIEVEDTAVAVIRFESGALATMHASTAAYPNVATRVQIIGDKGSGTTHNEELVYFHTEDVAGRTDAPMGVNFGDGNQADQEIAKYSDDDMPDLGFAGGHLRQYVDILRAIETKGKPTSGVADGLQCLATIKSVYLSATLGKPILVEEVIAGEYNDVEVKVGSSR